MALEPKVSGAHERDMNMKVYGRSYLVHGHLNMENILFVKAWFSAKIFYEVIKIRLKLCTDNTCWTTISVIIALRSLYERWIYK